ncbi:MAG TPA: hypothetical protein VKU00_25230 [Chthonomonadaceae bacterium]|nr:hypothetical protein [Chthonomonadaceae bacterium]
MRMQLLIGLALLVLALPGRTQGTVSGTSQSARADQRAETMRHYGFDPASALESRVRETPATVLKMFEQTGRAAPTPHTLTEEEQRKLSAAFAALPPLHRRILSEHLRSVSFLDSMPNTALTSTVNPGEPYRVCDITIRAAILHQNVSEWLTEKERSCFSPDGSPLSVSIEAGKRDALIYVLLHEATHIVDFCQGMTTNQPSDNPPAGAVPGAFTRDVWSDRTLPAPPYRDPLREHVRFYAGGEALPIDQAEAVYQSLRRTPFVSLYGGSNCADDLAEYVAVYHWTRMLKQPFRIVIRKEGKTVFTYEPMKSDLVRSRIGQMKPFYEKERKEDISSERYGDRPFFIGDIV